MTVVFPLLELLQKRQLGRRNHSVTRYLTSPWPSSLLFDRAAPATSPGSGGQALVYHPVGAFTLMTVLTLSTGSVGGFSMWLCDTISERGIARHVARIFGASSSGCHYRFFRPVGKVKIGLGSEPSSRPSSPSWLALRLCGRRIFLVDGGQAAFLLHIPKRWSAAVSWASILVSAAARQVWRRVPPSFLPFRLLSFSATMRCPWREYRFIKTFANAVNGVNRLHRA